MKQNILRKLMLIAVLLTSSHAFSHDFKAQNTYGVTIYYKITSTSDLTVEVTYRGDSYDSYGHEYSGQVAIPETVTYNSTTYSVTSIGYAPFYNCSGLTSVNIPNSVTSIGDYAFYNCSRLTSVNIPNSVTSIGEFAFSNCSGLTSVTIPDGVTSIGDAAFYKCSGLTSVTIPNSVTSIGEYAFCNCSNLTSVTIPNSVTSIGQYAFCNCSNLTSISIPNSVTSIGDSAFRDCSGLTSVTIPNSVTSIGYVAFGDCSGLESIIVESGNTVYDSRDNCNAIIATSTNTLITGCKNTTIPESVTSIGSFAFYNCSGLTSVTIPNSVTSIGYDAFNNCSGLTSVTIPNSVTSIGNYAFYNCSGLTSVTCLNTTPPTCGTNVFSNVSVENITLEIPEVSVSLYKSADTWKGFGKIDVLKPVDEYGLLYNFISETELEVIAGTEKYSGSIVIPSKTTIYGKAYNVTKIGSSAFSGCSGLTSVTIPNSVTSIGNYAFEDCSGLTSVSIPNSVTSIGNYAFRGCSGLESIIVESGNTVYDSRDNCNAIIATSTNTLITGCKNTTIPESVTSIGDDAFYNCSGLTSVTIPNSVTSIGYSAFSGCSGLESIIVESGNTGYDSRDNCNAIIATLTNTLITGCKNTTIPNSVTSIGSSAFEDCSGLTSVSIPNSVTSIGNYAFDNCTSLKELRIEDGESTLSLGYNYYNYNTSGTGEGLFYDCPLETLYLGRNIKYTDNPYSYPYTSYPERYGYSAFYNTTTLKSVTIGKSVTSIGNYTFYGCSGLTSVVFNAENCTTMGSSTNPVFSGCTNLTSITIGDKVKNIPDYAFSNCSGLTSVVFNAENCTTMGSSTNPVFSGCTNLTSITIGDKVKNIPDYAFSNCSGLTSVTIGNSVTSIGNYAFEDCSGLTSVSIPNSVTSIGNFAFYYCSNLTNIIIPNSVTSINESTFGYCKGLTSISIPNSVTSIGYKAFDNCTSLKELRIEDGESTLSLGYNYYNYNTSGTGEGLFYDCPLETLYLGRNIKYTDSPYSYPYTSYPKRYGYSAFYNTTTLKSVTIGKSVTSIGNYTFYGCSGLTSVTCLNTTPPTCGTNVFSNVRNITLEIPEVSVSLYKSADTWKGFGKIDVLKPVDEYGLLYNFISETELEVIAGTEKYSGSIVIPSKTTIYGKAYNVTKIGSSAFSGCSGLTSVTIPNSVTSIGDDAFEDCSGLTSVSIPNSVTSIGNYAFEDCSGLTSVTIPSSVTSIGYSAFRDCSGLTSVTIPNSVTSIGDEAFGDCSGLESIIVESGNTVYDSRDNCNAIIATSTNTLITGCKNTTIPNSVTSIGYKAFEDCSGLTSVTIPNSVTSIGYDAFSNCSGLTSVTIGNSVINIGSFAFSGCSGLTSVTIPNSVTSIGSFAFRGCSGLTSVTIPNSVTSIPYYAFDGCSGLTSVTIPNSVTSIGNYAFDNCTALKDLIIEDGESTLSLGYNSYDRREGLFYDCPLETLYLGRNLSYSSIDYYGYSPFYKQEKLKSVTIGNSVTSIGSSAFRYCSGLTSVTIPNSVTSIGDNAFYNTGWYNNQPDGILYLDNCCLGYKGDEPTGELSLKDNTRLIGSSAFRDCSGLTSVNIPNSVTSIGARAFYNTGWYNNQPDGILYLDNCCLGYKGDEPTGELSLKDNTRLIGSSAFEGCSSLTSVTIPNSVTIIGGWAFYNCTNLTEVTLGSSVRKIGKNAFYGAKRLGKIYSLNPTPPTCTDEDVFYGVSKEQCRVYVPIGAGIHYKIAIAWRYFTYIEEKEMSGVESTLTDNDVNVVVENGNIIVNGAEDTNIEVYSTNGQCVYNGTDTGIAVNTKGLYIVRVNGKSFKVIL